MSPHHSQEPDPRRADSGERTVETRLGAGQEPSSPFELPEELLKLGLKVLVCGGRDYNDEFTLNAWLAGLLKAHGITEIIEGGAPGADSLARKFAQLRKIPVRTFKADWQTHGKAAGPIRNRQMLNEGKPDLVVAFPGGRGTQNMIDQATRFGVPVEIITQALKP